MRDGFSVARVQSLHPAIRQQVISIIETIEILWPATIQIRVVQALRTMDEQAALYSQGRTKPGPIVTNAKPGSSFHNYGLAFDFAIMYDKDSNGTFEVLSWDINYDFDKNGVKDWMEVVQTFKKFDYGWGGDFTHLKDNPHLQKTFGYTWQALKAMYDAKNFINGTKYIKFR